MNGSGSAPLSDKKSLLVDDEFNVNLAIGTVTLFFASLLLFILNYTISCYSRPDIGALISKAAAESIMPNYFFNPEPVERMQFQLSVICSPIFILLVYKLAARLRPQLTAHPAWSYRINFAGVNLLIIYILFVFQKNLVHIPSTTKFFFANNAIYQFNFIFGLFFYGIFFYFFLLYASTVKSARELKVTNIISWQVVGLLLLQISFYNIFQLGTQDSLRTMETNPILYSISQVFAGKTLLVNLSCQYGLYAWFLNPLFKIFGLTLQTFSITMSVLNVASFLCIYLGIRKIIKHNLLSFIVFLALIFWQYWQTKMPLDTKPRFYYQYWPIRLLFPAVAFYLITIYFGGTEQLKRRLLPVLAFVSSFGVLWNFDSGLVVYGAVFAALLYNSLLTSGRKAAIVQALIGAGWMLFAFTCVVVLFTIATRVRSGYWPGYKNAFAFQSFFYVTGFYMMPMRAAHFWNFSALVYLITGTYCAYRIGKTREQYDPVLAFLFVLGLGLFAYFQGRSYDTNLTVVIYPAIIIAGVYCDKLLRRIAGGKIKFELAVVLFFIPFVFLADGAFSMLSQMPAIQNVAWENAFRDTATGPGERLLIRRMDFVKKNLAPNDTVLILSGDYESFYYTLGKYYNPANIPSSTEVFFHSELYNVLDVIKARKYPVIYDASNPWRNADTIVSVLSKNTYIDKMVGRSFFLMRPLAQSARYTTVADSSILYHYSLFKKISNTDSLFPKLTLPETFTMELSISRLDTTILSGACWIFNSATVQTPFFGIKMVQQTNDLTVFSFAYGNGTKWCEGPQIKLSCTHANQVTISVSKNMITVYNNSKLCGATDTGTVISNSEGAVTLNPDFPGLISEVSIWNR